MCSYQIQARKQRFRLGSGCAKLPILLCLAFGRTRLLVPDLGAYIITYAIVGIPYYIYSIMGTKTLLKLLRPLYYGLGFGGQGWSPKRVIQATAKIALQYCIVLL